MICLSFLEIYDYGMIVQHCLENLLPTAVEQSLNGTPGDSHLFTSLFLIQILRVAQAHGFELVQSENCGFEVSQRYALGLVNPVGLIPSAAASFSRSGHVTFLILCICT